jgi:hypothetical protein
MSDLEHRIAAALSDDAVTSAALSELIQETDAAIIAADATAESERAKALDPTLSPDPKAAREAMQAAEFARDRLRTVLPRLQKRHERAASAERKAAWIERYDAIKVEHDAAVAELRNLYPKVVGELVDLLRRNRELDARVRNVMAAKPFLESGEPDDGRRLLAIECAARGVNGFGPNDLSLDRHLVLPDFTERGKKSWPPHEVPLGVLLAEQMKMRGYG